ncbi:MAG: prenyltransferase/squalene oxidase repeat-containing protein, partial [Planctomycetota bacterium]
MTLFAGVTSAGVSNAAPSPDETAPALVAPADAAIERGLRYLAGSQQPDGTFGDRGRRMGANPAVVALGGMAFLGSGSSPGRGPFGEEAERCVDYLCSITGADGFIAADGVASHGPMYGHGFAALFLAEAYGMSPRDDLRDKVSAAVRLIVSAQNAEGGWRYQPTPTGADISVTICQIMALRAARNAGLHVPSDTVDRCIDYVKRCQTADGGFGYQPTDQRSLFPRSAAGV